MDVAIKKMGFYLPLRLQGDRICNISLPLGVTLYGKPDGSLFFSMYPCFMEESISLMIRASISSRVVHIKSFFFSGSMNANTRSSISSGMRMIVPITLIDN